MKLFSFAFKFTPLCFFAVSFALQAELPPFVYDEMKRNATEVFNVQIVEAPKAKAVVRGKRQQITYEAKVLRVIRTKSRIKSGGAIVIQSYHYAFGLGEVGPSNPRRLKKNDVVLAYLTKGEKGDEFHVAAGGHSFEQPKLLHERGIIEGPPGPVRIEPVPPVRVDPVRPRPDFPPPDPKLGQYHRQPSVRAHPDFPPPDQDDGPVMIGGGMAMPIGQEMPGRFTLLSAQIQQAGKSVPVVLKLDTQTGEVWQLKQVRTGMSFEPIVHDREPRGFNPRRPDIVIEPDGVGEIVPDRPIFRPRPFPVRPRPARRNLIEPETETAPRPRR